MLLNTKESLFRTTIGVRTTTEPAPLAIY